ncbi:MAG: N-acetylmuramic acid 6-phosphate etherase [Cryomorphaceae bacterium]|jgi:N-acetylmuramic acid 6-phosphate etherase|nr:N-acetylmuramic acid 6-phosphate etherase [Cryomorphaceae bacterium]MBT4518282.1 N-acetylmuramic acid 6-phosphate etherase [Cryomorphaceae bacterium]MBT4834834.1 N-acetylmuramic acid 6-phosphate etherase [Cryomorphaceae bacterium]MBT6214441.1 N-acetylmuramic acid 6-phosphate etherase [Cryomorphaceae bacterium]MDG1889207.1 N-acetylmuramic acid 6-phosphate etherase [Flavobacteriaceae bacterium]
MEFIKITEQESNHKDLEKKSVVDLVNAMHEEDNNALKAVHKVLPKITELINEIKPKIKNGGRLFYIGAGTSGRLGVLDASECPPTFGTPPEKVVGLVAGGIPALYSSIEVAEDDLTQAWKDLSEYNINSNDFVIGIAASGTTPYVIGGLKECQKNNISTGCIVCNLNSPLSKYADFKVEVIVGPEFLTGSSRLKAGTAQKLILNMISTISMILDGHVRGNKMIDMQMSNAKLNKRARRIIMGELGVDKKEADRLIVKHKSIRSAIDNYLNE